MSLYLLSSLSPLSSSMQQQRVSRLSVRARDCGARTDSGRHEWPTRLRMLVPEKVGKTRAQSQYAKVVLSCTSAEQMGARFGARRERSTCVPRSRGRNADIALLVGYLRGCACTVRRSYDSQGNVSACSIQSILPYRLGGTLTKHDSVVRKRHALHSACS